MLSEHGQHPSIGGDPELHKKMEGAEHQIHLSADCGSSVAGRLTLLFYNSSATMGCLKNSFSPRLLLSLSETRRETDTATQSHVPCSVLLKMHGGPLSVTILRKQLRYFPDLPVPSQRSTQILCHRLRAQPHTGTWLQAM